MRKLLSAMLVIAMLCGLLPALPVAAYTELHILATDFSLTEGEYGDTSPNGFDQTWYLKKYYPVEVYSGNYGTFVEMLSSEWLTYRMNVETAGTYTLAMDAATSRNTSITVTVNGTSYSVTLPSTSGVLNFTELTDLCSFQLNQGVNEIVIKNSSGSYFNYRELILSSDAGSGSESDYEEEETIIWWGNARWEAGYNGFYGDFTAADFTGDYSGKAENIGTTAFIMEPGDYGTYTFNAPYTGVYAMQLYVSDLPEGTAALRAVSGDYYAEFFMEYPGWSNTSDNLEDQPMYFTEGENTIVVTNVGDTTATVDAYDFGRLDATGYDSMQFISLVRKVSDMPAEGATPTFCPTPTPTAAPSQTPAPTAAPTATVKPTAAPTATPISVNPDVTDTEILTVYEAEDYTGGSLSQTTYDGMAAVKATSESTVSYTVTVESDTIYNLYMKGAAWKDVSFDIAIDGTTYYYETLHFQSDRSSTYSYNEECVASIPLTKGTHTLSFTFYCDSFYFDNFTLENTYSKQYQLLYALKETSTSQGIYEILRSCGDLISIDVEADTAGLFYPEMSFWGMVGKEYESYGDLVSVYQAVLAEELENPTVMLYDASGKAATSLGAGNYTVSINRGKIPTDVTFISAVYNAGKLAGNVQVLTSADDTVTFTLTGVEAGSNLKLMVFDNMERVKPYTAAGAYCDIYVATTGSSSNTGLSPDSPFGTIAQALAKVKTINSDMTGDIIIHVAPGVYRSNVTLAVDQTMGGKNGHKVIIRAEDMNHRPVFSGGEPLTGKWTKVSGQNYWVADTTTRETRALYVNGYQAVLARSEDVYYGEYITPANPNNDDHIADGLKISLAYNSDFPSNSRIPLDLEGETRLQMVYNLAWTNQRFPIESVSYDSDYAYLYTTYPYYNAFLLSGHTSTVMPTEGRVFYLENAMALLDRPGEFYFDKNNQEIYYYPYLSEDMTTAETYCAVTDVLMTVSGTSTANKVENLEFQGISFQHGAWDDATTYGAAFNQTDELRRGTATGYSQHLMHAQIQVNNADGLVFDGCEFANLGSSAMYLIEGVTNSKVINCDFHDISGGGVSISNFLHNSTYTGSGRCKNIEIGNNIFRRISQEFMNLPAVAAYYANSVNVHHNDIKDLPYSGVCIGWGWGYYEPTDCGNHIVSYNKITDVCQILDDGAQIYTLSDQPNMHLNDNYFIDPGNYRRGGVYFDEASGYISMCDNVVEKANDSNDYWLFARKYVNLNDNYVAYNHTDGGNPRYFSTFPMDTSGVEYTGNNINLTSWSDTAQRVMAEAGLEDKERVANVDYYPTWRTLPMLNLPADAVID